MVRQKCTLRLGLVVLAAAVVASRGALAQPLPRDAASEEEKAGELRKQGNALSREGKLAEAVDAYRVSFALRETFATAANLGNLELKLERYRDAAEHLAFALRVAPADATATVVEALKKSLAEARTHVSALRIRVNVAGAEVTVDGMRISARDLDFEVFVEPGAHTVAAGRAGYAAAERTASTTPGLLLEVELALAPLPPAQATPTSPTHPAPEGAEGKRIRVPLLIGGASAATLGTVLGAVFTVVANTKSSQAAALRGSLVARAGGPACGPPSPENAPDCGKLYGTLTSQSTFANAAAWSFIASGAVALGTGAYALWPVVRGKRPAAASVHALPTLSARSGGIVVAGEF
jgi:tetratricopeptide (TPR) repeat protein